MCVSIGLSIYMYRSVYLSIYIYLSIYLIQSRFSDLRPILLTQSLPWRLKQPSSG